TIDSFITRYEASLIPTHGPGTVSDPTDPAGVLLATKLIAGQANSGDFDAGDLAFAPVLIKQGFSIDLTGLIEIAGIVKITRQFHVDISPNRLDIAVIATMTLDPIGGVHVEGELLIDGEGLVAELTATIGVDFGEDIGLSFQASGLVQINTTGHTKELPTTHA